MKFLWGILLLGSGISFGADLKIPSRGGKALPVELKANGTEVSVLLRFAKVEVEGLLASPAAGCQAIRTGLDTYRMNGKSAERAMEEMDRITKELAAASKSDDIERHLNRFLVHRKIATMAIEGNIKFIEQYGGRLGATVTYRMDLEPSAVLEALRAANPGYSFRFEAPRAYSLLVKPTQELRKGTALSNLYQMDGNHEEPRSLVRSGANLTAFAYCAWTDAAIAAQEVQNSGKFELVAELFY